MSGGMSAEDLFSQFFGGMGGGMGGMFGGGMQPQGPKRVRISPPPPHEPYFVKLARLISNRVGILSMFTKSPLKTCIRARFRNLRCRRASCVPRALGVAERREPSRCAPAVMARA